MKTEKPPACHARHEGSSKICYMCNVSWLLIDTPPRCKVMDADRHMTSKDYLLYRRFSEKFEMVNGTRVYEDLPIRYLYKCCYGAFPQSTMTTREQQMAIGAYISRLNEKLAVFSLRVVPGISRSSYRLTRNA